MKAIVYIQQGSNPKNTVAKMVEEIMSFVHTQIFSRIEDLSNHLTKPIEDTVLAIFLIKDTEEISRLLCLASSFSELRILLVLPDRKKETLDLAYKLFPRYVCSVNDHYDELIRIIKKIVQKANNLKEEI